MISTRKLITSIVNVGISKINLYKSLPVSNLTCSCIVKKKLQRLYTKFI